MCEHQETLMNVRTRENEREKKIINLCARRNAQAIKIWRAVKSLSKKTNLAIQWAMAEI